MQVQSFKWAHFVVSAVNFYSDEITDHSKSAAIFFPLPFCKFGRQTLQKLAAFTKQMVCDMDLVGFAAQNLRLRFGREHFNTTCKSRVHTNIFVKVADTEMFQCVFVFSFGYFFEIFTDLVVCVCLCVRGLKEPVSPGSGFMRL